MLWRQAFVRDRTAFVFALLIVGSRAQVGDLDTGLLISNSTGANLDGIRPHIPRQVAPITETSSSYDYWWPYPPGGGASTSSTAAATTSTLPTSDVNLPISTDILATSSMLSSQFPLSSPTSAPPISSTSSSASLITITALPPSSTPSTHPHKPINLLYLIPAFAFVGVCMGSLCAWVLTCCCRCGNGEKEGVCVPGPKYMPAENQEKENFEDEDAVYGGKNEGSGSWFSRLLSRGSSSRSERSGQRDARERTPFSCPSVTPGAQEYAIGQTFDGGKDGHDPQLDSHEDAVNHALDNSPYPFSLLSPEERDNVTPYDSMRQKSIRRGLLDRIGFGGSASVREVSNGQGRVPTTPELEQGWAFAKDPVSPEYNNDGAKDTGLHSPLRRAQTEKPCIQSLSMRYGHGRVDSDLYVDDLRAPGTAHRNGGGPKKADNEIEGSLTASQDEHIWIPGSGFRIIEEDGVDVQRGRSTKTSRESSTSRVVGTEEEERSSGFWIQNLGSTISRSLSIATTISRSSSSGDPYTPIPIRKKRGGSRSPVGSASMSRVPSSLPSTPRRELTTSPTSAKTRSGAYRHVHRTPTRKQELHRVDSSVIPATPAVLMSPPLQSQLLFGYPVTEAVQSSAARKGRKGGSTATALVFTDSKERKTNKLHTSRQPSPLPFPSTSETSHYRNRLTKTPNRATNSTKDMTTDSPPQAVCPRDVAALSKVEEIVSISWSQRDLRGEGIPKSPTMFGAIYSNLPNEEETTMGIEQRLNVNKRLK